MARVKIDFPDQSPFFQTRIPVRITDINYGNHLGNDRLLAFAHEARMQWLQAHGFSELDAGGSGMIMSDAAIMFRAEGFYGDVLTIGLFVGERTAKSFELLYRLSTVRGGGEIEVARIKTGMIAFDYRSRTIVPVPEALNSILG